MYSVRAVVYTTENNETVSREIIIHDNRSPVSEMHLIDPKLKIADTSAGTFTAIMTPTNPGYSLVERLTSTIKVYKESTLIWTGRVLSESIDFWNRRTISCEGALAYLNDTVQPIAYYGPGKSPEYMLRTLLNIHNSKVNNDRKLYFGSMDNLTTYDNSTYIFQTDNRTTWEELKLHILDRYSCHLEIKYSGNNPYIHIYADYPNTATQEINFGENLLDFTRDWNLVDLATVILPRGKELDADTSDGQKSYITIKSTDEKHGEIMDANYPLGDTDNAVTVRGEYLINNSLYSKYGRIEQVVDFNDMTNSTDLFAMAMYYIYKMQFDEITLKVNAVDLHALTKSIVSFNLLDEVYCVSIPHGLYGQYFPISEIDIPLDKPESTTYTMTRSSTSNGISSNLSNFKSNVSNSFKNLTSTGHILDMAKINASSIINRKTTGYVSVVNMFDNEDEGVAQAVVISNNPEWKKASKYWIWNMNGLAYYSAARSDQIASSIGTSNAYPYREKDGYNFETPRYYDMAITMDGTIVANHIKTGILSDGMGYNYWNLETGEFSLQPNTKFQYGVGEDQYQTVYDLVWRTDEAYNKRTGAANYLNGTKDWAEWRVSGGWSQDTNDTEIMTCRSKSSVTWADVLMCPAHNIEYASIKGYTMTFSIEGAMSGDDDSVWGEITSTNAIVISFSLVSSSGTRLAKLEKAFSFDIDWSRRFVSVDMLDSSFTPEPNVHNYDNSYIDIWIYNRSLHGVYIRRPQFERGNTPTDWGISDVDIDKEAQLKADNAENNSKSYAEGFTNEAVEDLSKQVNEDIKNLNTTVKDTYIPAIEDGLKKFTKAQLAAFDESMTQSEILNRLTNNGRTQGIYLQDRHLYINAEYIRSGTLDAGLLKTGIIYAGRDSIERQNNYWDLTRGVLKTENSIFTNAEVTGTFTSSSYDNNIYMKMENGTIEGYASGETSMVAPSDYYYVNQGRVCGGLILSSTGDVIIGAGSGKDLRVGTATGSRYTDTWSTVADEWVNVNYLTSVWENDDGTVGSDPDSLHMHFVRGMLVEWHTG